MFIQAAGALKAYLEQRRLAGATHVPLRAGMLDRLRAAREKADLRKREVRRLVEATMRRRRRSIRTAM
ncbi:MAG TPA: hypothetical protein PLP58_23530 [Prosthecobacter sp.]|nr:hypothetical protein [Prosthecobacter sp.]